jgi:rubrerythrin
MAIDFQKLTLKDALDLAILIEEDAKERYDQFVKIAGGRYPGDASDMFRDMAMNETRHRDELLARRTALFGDAPRNVTSELIEDAEAPDRGTPRVFMSARQAMEVALASEEKAYDFFAQALKGVSDPEVKALFEQLRDEEAQHQRWVKQRIEKLPPGPDIEDDEADAPGSDAGN